MKKVLGFIAASMLLAAPALAADAPTYNCDYQPSCEVAPGVYGAMASPVKSKFDLSIAGFVRLDYAYNSTNLGATGFLTPTTGDPQDLVHPRPRPVHSHRPKVSRFAFKVAGPTFLGAKTSALIESGFFVDRAPITRPLNSGCAMPTVLSTGPTPRCCSARPRTSSAR